MNHYEVVIALVAPRGISLDRIIAQLERAIERYGYSVEHINLLDIVGSQNKNSEPLAKRNLIDIEGGHLSQLRAHLLKDLAVENTTIPIFDVVSSLLIKLIEAARERIKSNTVFILDNLKHPKELDALRRVYQGSLYTIGVTDSLVSRIRNKKTQFLAENDGSTENAAVDKSVRYIVDDYLPDSHFSKQESSNVDVANKVGDAYFLSDFFINLNSSEFSADSAQLEQQIQQSTERFVDLIFGAPNVTPTKQEQSMFLAYTSALRSGDLSRQVGSTIVNEIHDVIALGANEVPMSGGGQYWANSSYIANTKSNTEKLLGSEDQRDFVLGYDTNAKEKEQITCELIDLLLDKGLISNSDRLLAEETLKNSSLKDITEYGRVVHAEMSALMSAARNGVSVRGMSMFCTTYPCHNCAKHLVAAGIDKVNYIEPYPKSKAVASHDDSIFDPDNMNLDVSLTNRDELIDSITEAYLNDALSKKKETNSSKMKKLVFEPFSGVGPRRYIDLFSLALSNGRPIKRKNGASALKLERKQNVVPRIPISALQNSFHEQEFFKELARVVGDNFHDRLIISRDTYINSRNLKNEGYQKSTVKFWHQDLQYGYIKSGNGEDFAFSLQNILNKEYLPKEGDVVSFIPKKGRSIYFANEVSLEKNTVNEPNSEYSQKCFKSTIQNWFTEKNYGFISNADGSNYYFSMSNVLQCSKSKVAKGQKVEFYLSSCATGKTQAKSIKVIN